MLDEQRVDVVIVTSVDRTHDHYIVTALEHGCDVITEKPMTTDADKCQRILDAQTPDRPQAHRVLQLPLRTRNSRGQGADRSPARSATSSRSTSSGCSTPGTAPTTSAAGTATSATPAA